jgi:thimet oligopeptidase
MTARPRISAQLIASKNANAGHLNSRQLVFGLFDQTIHGTPEPTWPDGAPPLAESFAQIQAEVMGIPATAGTCMPASFGHLAGGYDAQYYGYMWSEVFAQDMFERIRDDPDGGGVFSHAGGKAYRDCILAPGGALDADAMLLAFLGRAPTQEAFLRSKGLS